MFQIEQAVIDITDAKFLADERKAWYQVLADHTARLHQLASDTAQHTTDISQHTTGISQVLLYIYTLYMIVYIYIFSLILPFFQYIKYNDCLSAILCMDGVNIIHMFSLAERLQ